MAKEEYCNINDTGNNTAKNLGPRDGMSKNEKAGMTALANMGKGKLYAKDGEPDSKFAASNQPNERK